MNRVDSGQERITSQQYTKLGKPFSVTNYIDQVKPKKELTNHFLTKDFIKMNEIVHQTTFLEANRTS